MSKKDAQARESSTRLKIKNMSFDWANLGFGGVANTIKKIWYRRYARGYPVAVFWCKTVYRPHEACKQHKRRYAWRRSQVNQGRPRTGFGQLYNQVLGKPIAFPTLKSSLYIVSYGRTAQQVIPDMDTLVENIIVQWNLQDLALVLDGVTVRGALFGQDALQLINNIVDHHLDQEVISMERAAGRINNWQRLALRVYRRHGGICAEPRY